MKAKNFKYKKQDWQEKYLTNSTNESLIFLFSNPFHANLPFLYHQKMTKNLWFSLVFRGYENGTMAWSELKGPWGQKLNPVFFLYNSNDFIEKVSYKVLWCFSQFSQNDEVTKFWIRCGWRHTRECTKHFIAGLLCICDALRDLVPFVQF